MTNFGDVIKLLAPILLMQILKNASPIHTAHLTRPFFSSEYKKKVWLTRLIGKQATTSEHVKGLGQ